MANLGSKSGWLSGQSFCCPIVCTSYLLLKANTTKKPHFPAPISGHLTLGYSQKILISEPCDFALKFPNSGRRNAKSCNLNSAQFHTLQHSGNPLTPPSITVASQIALQRNHHQFFGFLEIPEKALGVLWHAISMSPGFPVCCSLPEDAQETECMSCKPLETPKQRGMFRSGQTQIWRDTATHLLVVIQFPLDGWWKNHLESSDGNFTSLIAIYMVFLRVIGTRRFVWSSTEPPTLPFLASNDSRTKTWIKSEIPLTMAVWPWDLNWCIRTPVY